MTRQRVILHVDMDAFFVSVEELLNPALKGKPVVVGGDPYGRGVVSAASYKAREYGIRSGMAAAQARRLCPKAIFLRGSGHRYTEYSRKVMDILRRYTPAVEQVSVDEAYLDLTGCGRLHKADPVTIAQRIHDSVARETGLPCSLGLGASKLIAKIAANAAKPNGLMWIRPGYEASFLAPLPIGAMPGIGPASEKVYHRLGVRHIGDLARLDTSLLRHALGKYGEVMALRARGGDPREVDIEPEEEEDDDAPPGPVGFHRPTSSHAKSVSRETTFAQDVDDPERLRAALSYLAESVGRRLRRKGLMFNGVTLKLRHADFTTFTRARALPSPSDDTAVIFRVAGELLDELYTRRVRVRLIGVGVNTSPAARQMPLFGQAPSPTAALHRHLDTVRDRFGFDATLLARSFLHAAERERRHARHAPLSANQGRAAAIAGAVREPPLL